MQSLAVTLACYLLKLPLSLRDRTRLVCAILDANNAVPLRDMIAHSPDGTLLIDGRPIEMEKAMQLRESARAAIDNTSRSLIIEQIASIAGRRGVSEGDTPEKLIFYRAALWWAAQEQEHLTTLAQMQ